MSTGTGSYPYLGYFNLQQAPFTPVVDDAFFFADPAISQRLEMLRHLVRYSDLLLLVVGESGSGKTTLLQQFLLSSGEQTHLCRVDGEYGMDTGRLLERIAAGFGLPSEPRNTAELAESLGHIAGNQPFLLLIDDAHRLSVEALTALLELAERDGPGGRLLRIVLFCEPSINELLADPAIAPLRDRITQTLEIPPFTEEQTAAYLVHRMRVAGLRGESPFSAKLVKMIHKGAGGNPARINELAHQALMEISGEEPRRTPLALLASRGSGIPPAGIAAAVVLVLLLPLWLLFSGGEEEKGMEQRASREVTLPIGSDDGDETVVVLNDEPSADAPTDSGEDISPDVRGDESAAPGSERHAPPRLKGWHSEGEQGAKVEVASAAPAGGPVVEIPAAAQNQSPVAEIVPPVIEAVLPDPVPASSKRQTVILRGSGFGPGSRVTVGWTGRVKELAPEQVEVTSPEEMRIAIVTGRAADTWTVRVTNPDGTSSRIVEFQVAPMKAELEASPAGSSAAGGEKAGLHREAWLLAQDPAHYTVQLMGAGKESDVLAFVEQHRLQGDLAYFRGVSQGKDWYSLVTGVYPDFKSANEAAARLAKRFEDVSPWVRQIGNIRISLADLAAVKEQKAAFHREPKGLRDIEWLRRQNPRHYTLQLLAGTEKRSIEAFLRRHGPADGAVYFRTRRGGKDWYALIYNSYPTKSAALAALERLPSAWRKHRPWMRSFGSIQKELAQTE